MFKKSYLLMILLFCISSIYSQHQRNLIIYNTTSTGCGHCTCLDSIFDEILPNHYPQTIVVEFHNIGSNPHYRSFQGDSIVPTFLHTIAKDPSCFINGMGYDVNYKYIIDTLNSLYNEFSQTPIDLDIQSKEWDPDNQKVSFDIHFKNNGPALSGDYWYNVILTENNLISLHQTKDSCSTANEPGNYKNDYVNNNVTRKMVYWTDGTSLIDGTWEPEQEFVKSCSFIVDPDSAWIPDNCNFIINLYLKEDSIYQSPVLQAIKYGVTSGSSTEEKFTSPITLISPNPAKNKCNVHLSISNPSKCNLELFSLSGERVLQIYDGYLNQGKYNVEIPLQNLSSGTYIISFQTENKKYSTKLIKQ